MEKKGIKESRKIVITGPESSGKTTLFEQLKNLSGFESLSSQSTFGSSKLVALFDIVSVILFL